MKAIKCIIRQHWTISNPEQGIYEQRTAYVTNEDGTPHIYASLKAARIDIAGNGYAISNRDYAHDPESVDVYGTRHESWIVIIREGSTEYEDATARAEIIAAVEDSEERTYIEAEAIANRWSPEETADAISYRAAIRTADHAAAALINAYAEAIGDTVTKNDPEAIAARLVARDDLTGTSYRATNEDRETVANMVEAIADRAREQAEPATVTAYEYDLTTTRTASGYRCTVTDRDTGDVDEIATAPTATEAIEHAAALIDAAFVCDETNSAHDAAAGIVALALDKLDAAGIQETPEQRARLEEYAREYVNASPRDYWEDEPDDEPAPRDIYQRFELLAYLGDPDAYDVDAIEAEATEYDPRTGRTVWAAFGGDLAAIAERHELYSYAAI